MVLSRTTYCHASGYVDLCVHVSTGTEHTALLSQNCSDSIQTIFQLNSDPSPDPPSPGVFLTPFRNLLGDNPSEKLDIKMNPDGSGQLYVPGLTQIAVQSPEDINRVRGSACQRQTSCYS